MESPMIKITTLALIFILNPLLLSAINLWEPCNNGISGAYVRAIAVEGDNMYIASLSNGIYFSNDNGNNWEQRNSGISDFYILCLAVSGKNIFAGTLSGVFFSSDNGNNWELRDSGFANKNIGALFVKDNIILAGTMGLGIFYSTNNGKFWQTKQPISKLYSTSSFAAKGNKIFAGTTFDMKHDSIPRVFCSTNDGLSWFGKDNGLPIGLSINSLAVKGELIFAGSNKGLYVSSDEGENWILQNNELPILLDLAVSGNNLFCATSEGVYLSTDNGKSWIEKLPHISTQKIITKDNLIIAGTTHDIYISDDIGDNWVIINSGLMDVNIGNFAIQDNNIFAGGSSLYLSTDHGNSWTKKILDLKDVSISGLVSLGNYIFCSSLQGIHLTSDLGNTWEEKNSGLINSYIACIKVNDNHLFISNYSNGIFSSSDLGNTWEEKTSGLSKEQKKKIAGFIEVNGNNIIFANYTSHGFLLSTDKGASWTTFDRKYDLKFDSVYISSFNFNGNDIFAAGSKGVYYFSSDLGITWEKRYIDPSKKPTTYAILIRENYIFAGTNIGIYFSTDYGKTWAERNEGLPKNIISSFLIKGNYIYAGTTGGVYRARLSDFGISPVEEFDTQTKYYTNHFYASAPYPTPSQSIVRADVYWDLSFDLNEAVQGVYNSFGELVERTENLTLTKSTNAPAQIVWDCSRQSNGVYFIAIRHHGRTDCIPIVVSR